MQRIIVALLAVCLFLAGALFGPGLRTTAQQDSTALEATVADLSQRVSLLERRVSELSGLGTPLDQRTHTAQPTATTQTAQSRVVTFSGVGTMVSEKQSITEGRYKVTATIQVADASGFICYLHADGGGSALLFNEIRREPGTWTVSTVIDIDGTGNVFVEVSNTDDPWTITFEPF